ncbi:integrin alpha-11-like [Clarias magur]|uniref:Integrin alpha-11-like n=1 Tax=Clarias magur TaxID=1594786 RepID=A0A8J4T548_CLAMG|nr:integrin alpha-11-like [Clarias magur]
MEMLILFLFFGVSFSDAFNVDVSNPEQLSGNGKEFFGYRVLEYQSDEMKQ